MPAWFGNENLSCTKFHGTKKGEYGVSVFNFLKTLCNISSHCVYAE